MKPLWRLDIPRDVQIAKYGLATLTVAFGSVFLYFISEFKDVRNDLASIQSSVSSQAATASSMQGTLNCIEDKLDGRNDNAQASPPIGQTNLVRERTPR